MKTARVYDDKEALGDALAQVRTGRPGRGASSGARRLLTDIEAAAYIGASRSYVRALVANRVLRRVELPPTDGSMQRAARMLRIDVRDLDAWIDQRKT
jgi:hypothetical protein